MSSSFHSSSLYSSSSSFIFFSSSLFFSYSVFSSSSFNPKQSPVFFLKSYQGNGYNISDDISVWELPGSNITVISRNNAANNGSTELPFPESGKIKSIRITSSLY